MRLTLAVLISFVCASFVHASDLQIIRVWPSYRQADSFKRISEYFSGNENTGSEIVLRTQPNERTGYYFLTRIKNTGPAIANARVELQLITPVSPEVQTHSFDVALPTGKKVLQLGLTGGDWTNSKTKPVAWLVRFLTVDGVELAREQSYLWSQPDLPKPK